VLRSGLKECHPCLTSNTKHSNYQSYVILQATMLLMAARVVRP
jgi:hypothetical protein